MLTMSTPRLELAEEEREALEAVARSSSLPHRVVLQAKGLLSAEGVANNEIARRCAVTPNAAVGASLVSSVPPKMPGAVKGALAPDCVRP